ncbi:MAG: adenine phosphoribosyltransferase [bacterium]|jgi:adenine phosphoribosyltransferase|nr:adenine phosphoribosyltransferase [bacterium]
MNLSDYIRTVPDFPKPGIVFKDITPLLQEPQAFDACLRGLLECCPARDFDAVLGIEARGFIFGAALAYLAGKPFVPARKPGKLPWRTVRHAYQLEYGEDALELHADAFQPGTRVLLVDDLLATGGTLLAAAALARELGGLPVAAACVVELAFLPGRRRLEEDGVPVHSLIRVEEEGG